MPEASNWVLVRSFLPAEKPKMTIVYENEILINIDWLKTSFTILFTKICGALEHLDWSQNCSSRCGSYGRLFCTPFEPGRSSFAALSFVWSQFDLNSIIILKHDALGRLSWTKSASS
jgi:hypothetical protein